MVIFVLNISDYRFKKKNSIKKEKYKTDQVANIFTVT